MTTSKHSPRLLVPIAAAVLLLAPAAAGAAPLVPPENSAVNQYTESFPTGGGERETHEHGGEDRSPKKVLGDAITEKLEQRGAEGREAAEVAAETAPVVTEVEVEVDSEPQNTESGGGAPATGGNGGSGGGNAAGGGSGGGGETAQRPAEPTGSADLAAAEGSSGLSSVLDRATGSAGGLGLFLPLLILATIAWAAAYLTRHRRPLS